MKTMLNNQQPFVSVGEAAEIIGCSRSHVRHLLIAGIVKGLKLNERAWAVDRKSAIKYGEKPAPTGRPRKNAE